VSGVGGPDARILVVTGQSGTGKSTVCRWLAERGGFVLDADRIGHEVLTLEEVRSEVVEAFSTAILGEDGQIDRKILGKRVFSDEQALSTLNGIVHPPLLARLEERIEELKRSRAVELIVVDAALHFEFQPRIAADAVLMTVTDPEEQLRRIIQRDGIDREAARARLDRQARLDRHRGEADIVLDTTASPGRVRREMLLRVDAALGLSLAESEFPPEELKRRAEDHE